MLFIYLFIYFFCAAKACFFDCLFVFVFLLRAFKGGFFFVSFFFFSKLNTPSLKPPFLRDTENGRNSRNRGVENGKWEVSFSEMIRLIFAQNLSNLFVLSIKCWAKSIFYLLFLQNVALFSLLGSYFCKLNALFGSSV